MPSLEKSRWNVVNAVWNITKVSEDIKDSWIASDELK